MKFRNYAPRGVTVFSDSLCWNSEVMPRGAWLHSADIAQWTPKFRPLGSDCVRQLQILNFRSYAPWGVTALSGSKSWNLRTFFSLWLFQWLLNFCPTLIEISISIWNVVCKLRRLIPPKVYPYFSWGLLRRALAVKSTVFWLTYRRNWAVLSRSPENTVQDPFPWD